MSRSVRIAVVAPTWGDRWREEDVVVARVAGALACAADVEVLVGDRPPGSAADEPEGALRIRRFPRFVRPASRRRSLDRVLLGRASHGEPAFCRCVDALAPKLLAEIPRVVAAELSSCEGGHAPDLFTHLRSARYDAVVFAGLRFASTVLGAEAAPSGARTVLLPLVRRTPELHLSLHRAALSAMERVLTLTPAEGRRVAALGAEPARLREIGFAAAVSEVAERTDPAVPSTEGLLTVARDWTRGSLQWRLRREAIALRPKLPDVRICLVGRGAERFADDGWTVARQVFSRVDVWRWTSRAIAVLEPEPDRLLALEAIEAMMYGTPVLARADSGAAREHAELGNGGLWYRSLAELRACVKALRDPDVRGALGAQARRYATERYGRPEEFIRRVQEAVLGGEAA